MFIYSRRQIQRQIYKLASVMKEKELEILVGKLNRPGDRRMSNYWEVAILHALSKHGSIEYERELESGKHPGVWFQYPGKAELAFAAGIATVSDSQLDRNNRTMELQDHLRREARKAGVPGHGIDAPFRSISFAHSNGRRCYV